MKGKVTTLSKSDSHMSRLRKATIDYIRDQCTSKRTAERIITAWLIFENGLHKLYQAAPPELESSIVEMESLCPGIFAKINHMRISYSFPTGNSGRKPKIPDHKIRYAARLHSRHKSLNDVLGKVLGLEKVSKMGWSEKRKWKRYLSKRISMLPTNDSKIVPKQETNSEH